MAYKIITISKIRLFQQKKAFLLYSISDFFKVFFILTKGVSMLLDWTLIFLVLALVAGVFGFTGIAAESAGIAKILFIIFLVIYIASFVFNRAP
jgi:uncharacterized membrane protein YtjA (UPF0391 family)